MNAITILKGFAEAQARMIEVTDRERHDPLRGERPEGEGWVLVGYDKADYAIWERKRMIKS